MKRSTAAVALLLYAALCTALALSASAKPTNATPTELR